MILPNPLDQILKGMRAQCSHLQISPFNRSLKVTSYFKSPQEGIFPSLLNTIKSSTCIAAVSCAVIAGISTTAIIHPPPCYASDASLETTTAAGTASTITIDESHPVVDLAKIIPSGKINSIQSRLQSLERDTSWKVRVLTRYGPSESPSVQDIRNGWQFDPKTIVVFVDPTSPNILNFKFGTQIQKILPRPFFTELQGRYGNLFYVREKGDFSAIDETLDALDVCLRRNGCAVPPGLPQDQYFFTLGTSIAGGAIAGSVLRLDPQGFVQRRWVWLLVFFPLWGTLSINFGIGPIVTRTDDIMPVILNIAATVGTAALIYFYPQAAKVTGLTVDIEDDE